MNEKKRPPYTLKIEQKLCRREKKYFDHIQTCVESANCSTSLNDILVDILLNIPSSKYLVGRGEFHIWIHRKMFWFYRSFVRKKRLAVIEEDPCRESFEKGCVRMFWNRVENGELIHKDSYKSI